MQYIKISQNLKNGINLLAFITTYRPSLSVFMTNNMHKTAAFYTEQCTGPSLFHKLIWRQFKLVTEELWLISDTIFFTCTHAHKSFSNETKTIQVQFCAWRVEESVIHCWLGVGTVIRCWLGLGTVINDSSANILHTSYWESLWGQTCCSVIDAKLQLKHACASKKWHKQDPKSYRYNKMQG